MQRYDFDTIRFPRHPLCRPAQEDDVPAAIRFVSRLLPDFPLDDPARFVRLIRFDPDMIQLFYRSDEIIGLYAMLFLNSSGLRALLSDELNAHTPSISHLAPAPEQPKAIYNWLVILPGQAASGFSVMSELLYRKRYAAADLYARPLTDEGLRIMLSLGYRLLPGHKSKLYRYERICNRTRAPQVAA